MVFVPRSEPLQIESLFCLIQQQESALGTFFHHVVEAEGHTVRQAFYKCVLRGQYGKQLFRIGVSCDEARHFHGKLIGKPHDRQKLLLLFRERVDHGGGERGINVGIVVGQLPTLGECPQVQIDGGKPALAGIEQGFDLRVGKLGTASVSINGKLRVV